MAKAKAPKSPKNGKSTPDVNLPEGFQPVTGGKVDGWFVVEAGNTLQGIIRDTFLVKGQFGEKRVYKIEATMAGTNVMTQEDGEFQASEGTIVGLDEKGWLRGLAAVPKGSEVYIECIGQEEVAKKGQKPAWKFAVGVKPAEIPFR